MADVQVKFVGVNEILRALDRLVDAADEGAQEFTDDLNDEVYDLSQIYVPVETGLLKSTGRKSRDHRRHSYHAEVKYGGLGVDYAVFVHEIPPDSGGRGGTGNKHAPPTRYKYLESAALLVYGGADHSIYKYVGRRLERAWH